jgi:pimeloyl-ACP methyl ester carboxylesterase
LSADYDLVPALRRLDIPTLVLHGDRDLIPVEAAARIAEAMPRGRLVLLAGCGHFAYLQVPDLVYSHIGALLTGS